MKKLLFLLLLFLPVLAFGQYPAGTNKIRLGNQTTGDGLVYRGSGAPAYTPTILFGAWAYIDTVANKIYQYQGGSWHELGGGTVTPDSLEYTSSTQILGIKNSNEISLLINIDGTLAGSNTAAQPLRVDTSVMASKAYVTGLGAVDGAGTADFIPKWSDANTLTNSQVQNTTGLVRISDNNAAAAVKFEVDQWTTAGRPTGDTAVIGFNTTLGNLDFYGLAAWENPVKSSTGNGLFTAGSVLFADANGRTAEDSALRYNPTTNELSLGGAPSSALLTLNRTSGYATAEMINFQSNGIDAALIRWQQGSTRGYELGKNTSGEFYLLSNGGTVGSLRFYDAKLGINRIIRGAEYTLDINSTGGMRIPVGTTVQQPTGATGVMRYNTTTNSAEIYHASAWKSLVTTTLANGRFTSTYIPYADANGDLTESSNLNFTTGSGLLTSGKFRTSNQNEVANISSKNIVSASTYGSAIYASESGGGWTMWNSAYSAGVAGGEMYSGESSGFPVIMAIAGNNSNNIINPGLNSTYGSIAIAGKAGGVGGGRPMIGVYGAGSSLNTSYVNNDFGVGVYGYAYSETAGDTSAASLYGVIGKGTGTFGKNSARSIFGVYGESFTKSAQTGYAIYANPTGTGTNWGVYSAAGENAFAGNTMIGAVTTPSRTLHVTGEARITDLVTDVPVYVVGADADGDLGRLVLSGASITSGGGADTLKIASVNFGNGLTQSGSVVKLGGTTTESTTVSGAYNIIMQYQSGFVQNNFTVNESSAYLSAFDLAAGVGAITAKVGKVSMSTQRGSKQVTILGDTLGVHIKGTTVSSYSYDLPVTSPSSTLNDTSVFVQIGNGTTAEAKWVDKDLFGSSQKDTIVYFNDGVDYNIGTLLATNPERFRRITCVAGLSSGSTTSDGQLLMGSPSSSVEHVEIVLIANDANTTYDTKVSAGTNEIMSGAGTYYSAYTLPATGKITIRAIKDALDSDNYKWFLSY